MRGMDRAMEGRRGEGGEWIQEGGQVIYLRILVACSMDCPDTNFIINISLSLTGIRMSNTKRLPQTLESQALFKHSSWPYIGQPQFPHLASSAVFSW